jgi:hypothetical protein
MASVLVVGSASAQTPVNCDGLSVYPLRPKTSSTCDLTINVVLQCLDIVTGAMWFRLNDMHLEKVSKRRRALIRRAATWGKSWWAIS